MRPLDRIDVRTPQCRTHSHSETCGSRFLNNAHVLYRKCLFIVRMKYSARTYRIEWKLHALPPPVLSCALDLTHDQTIAVRCKRDVALQVVYTSALLPMLHALLTQLNRSEASHLIVCRYGLQSNLSILIVMGMKS